MAYVTEIDILVYDPLHHDAWFKINNLKKENI